MQQVSNPRALRYILVTEVMLPSQKNNPHYKLNLMKQVTSNKGVIILLAIAALSVLSSCATRQHSPVYTEYWRMQDGKQVTEIK